MATACCCVTHACPTLPCSSLLLCSAALADQVFAAVTARAAVLPYMHKGVKLCSHSVVSDVLMLLHARYYTLRVDKKNIIANVVSRMLSSSSPVSTLIAETLSDPSHQTFPVTTSNVSLPTRPPLIEALTFFLNFSRSLERSDAASVLVSTRRASAFCKQ